MSGLSLNLDADSLKPVIEAVVRATIKEISDGDAMLSGRLQVPESEAAALLSLRPHQLRDLRLRGEIEAVRGPKGKVFYTREQLLAYQFSHRWEK